MPDKIRVSYGTAIVLGLLQARQDVPPTTAYLLWDPGCEGSCSFCPRAGNNPEEDKLSRITWPEFPFAVVFARLSQPGVGVSRICLQTGFNSQRRDELIMMAASLVTSHLPVCVNIHPAEMAIADRLFQKGVDRVGIGLDAAGPETYARHKKRNWQEDWPRLKDLMKAFPGRIEVHIIFGLGDSEETFIRCLDDILNEKGQVAIFALTPPSPRSSDIKQPTLASYRRIQVFRHLRQEHQIKVQDLRFTDGQMTSVGRPESEILSLLSDGIAFRTSGCGDCNRPYYNERPRGPMFNFPRSLTPEETHEALKESDLFAFYRKAHQS